MNASSTVNSHCRGGGEGGGGGGWKKRGRGPRNDVLTACKVVTVVVSG